MDVEVRVCVDCDSPITIKEHGIISANELVKFHQVGTTIHIYNTVSKIFGLEEAEAAQTFLWYNAFGKVNIILSELVVGRTGRVTVDVPLSRYCEVSTLSDLYLTVIGDNSLTTLDITCMMCNLEGNCTVKDLKLNIENKSVINGFTVLDNFMLTNPSKTRGVVTLLKECSEKYFKSGKLAPMIVQVRESLPIYNIEYT